MSYDEFEKILEFIKENHINQNKHIRIIIPTINMFSENKSIRTITLVCAYCKKKFRLYDKVECENFLTWIGYY